MSRASALHVAREPGDRGFRSFLHANALAETINGLYRTEVIPPRAVAQPRSRELATLEWVDWFNNRLLLEPIGNIPPEAEARYYAQLEDPALR